ncbi:hypothetical protein SIM32_10860 [Bacillus cereus group sp. WSBC 10925]|nr:MULTISPECIES: hypothetical protein [Bacillus cereus group]MDX5784958.1 hypothetical protein [Bacillus cereus group sp. WSBC 10925]
MNINTNGVERKHTTRLTALQAQQIAEAEKLTGRIMIKQTVRQKN